MWNADMCFLFTLHLGGVHIVQKVRTYPEKVRAYVQKVRTCVGRVRNYVEKVQ